MHERLVTLSKLVGICRAISDVAVVHISEDSLQFILEQAIAQGGSQVWTGIQMDKLFEEHTIESLNDNHIHFRLSLDHLDRALKSGLGATDVLLKLAKKNSSPFLSLQTSSREGHAFDITQDVPLTMMSKDEFAMIIEPQLPRPEVNIVLPPLKIVLQAIDHMKHLSEAVTIRANMNKQLHLAVATEMVSADTQFDNLSHPQVDRAGEEPPDPSVEAEDTVSVQAFRSMCLAHTIEPDHVILCMIPGKAIVCHVLMVDLFLTYYIPVMSQEQ